ncbi:MAG: YihY/virulence factor BrkB family protein [Bacteroides sp.]
MRLKKTKLYYQRFLHFIHRDVWIIEEVGEYSTLRKRLLRLLRIILLVTREFTHNSVQLRATALTYYSMMSMVPIVAMGFGIAKGFGLEERLTYIIHEKLDAYPELSDKLVEFSTALLERTGGGLIAGIGVVLLFWTVIKVFNNIEKSFNVIWRISTPRSWFRKFSDYLSMMLLAPLLILAASSVNIFLKSFLSKAAQDIEVLGLIKTYVLILLRISPYILLSLAFTFLYVVMPNTKVKFSAALLAGLVAGIGFAITQWFYLAFQFGVSKFNGIYGSFAALPLFLVWLQLSWLIVLVGAELSYAIQNVQLYEFERNANNLSPKRTKILSMLLLATVVQRFQLGKAPLTSEALGKKHGIPLRLVNQLLQWMVEAELISMVYTEDEKVPAYQPGQSIEKYSLERFIRKHDEHGNTIAAKGKLLPIIEELYEEYMQRANSERYTLQSIIAQGGE